MNRTFKYGELLKVQRCRRTGLTLIEFLVVAAIVVILIAMLLPAVRDGRTPARRTMCKNNLKQIAIALHNYHDSYGSLPPAYTVDANGNRLHSWRTLILPYLDHGPLYGTIDLTKPWDDPANAESHEINLQVYQCPSTNLTDGRTTYLALVGEECVFPMGQSRSIDEITDGTSNTVMVVEAAEADAVHWMSPNDADANFFKNLSSDTPAAHPSGANILFADGSVRFLNYEELDESIRGLATVAGDDDTEWRSRKY